MTTERQSSLLSHAAAFRDRRAELLIPQSLLAVGKGEIRPEGPVHLIEEIL